MEGRNQRPELDDLFSANTSRLPDDTVFYSIYPDFCISTTTKPETTADLTSQLQSVHLQILQALTPFISDYLWQHEPFTLSLSSPTSEIPHLHGKLRFGDNLEDEWFVVFLLFHLSNLFPYLSIRVWDTDGEFLLIEAAFHLPRWINPENSENRVFIRENNLHIIPKQKFPSNPSISDALKYLTENAGETKASESVQRAIKNRISDYPEKAKRNLHNVRVRVPVSVAQVLEHEPCLISLAVEGFYDRDIDTMKFAAKMERLLSKGKGEELVLVNVKMSRAMYAQLVQQRFQAPKCYPMMPDRSDRKAFMEAELGMKTACGLEMMYQQRKKEGEEGKGCSWEVFKESLVNSGYFQGLLPGSKDYKRLMANAEDYYRKSSVHHRASEMLSAPVRRIDEILSSPHSLKDFMGHEVPPSDDDSWLYTGEDELNSALMERQEEMEIYEEKRERKRKGKYRDEENGSAAGTNKDEFDLGDMAKTMQAFVHKMSSFEGAEVPENRDLKEVELDVDGFFKEIGSVLRPPAGEDGDNVVDIEEGSSSDMDFDGSEDGSDLSEGLEEDNEVGKEDFMRTYSDALNQQLKDTTLKKSFVHAKEQAATKKEGTTEDMDEDFTAVDVDFNLVKSLIDSYSSQEGLAGPASNLLGLMGVKMPKDSGKDK